MNHIFLIILMVAFSFPTYSIEKENNKGLNYAALTGNGSEIRALAKNGINLNEQRESDGITALHLAAMEGKTESIRTLIELGADVNILDRSGHSALDFTHYHSKYNADLLIAAGGKRYKQWGGKNIFNKDYAIPNLSSILYFIIFVISSLIFKVLIKKYNPLFLSFGIVGITYFSVIVIPQIMYSGINALPYIKTSEIIFSFIPIAIAGTHLIIGEKNIIITKSSKFIIYTFITISIFSIIFLLLAALALSGRS